MFRMRCWLLLLCSISFAAYADTLQVITHYSGTWSSELKENLKASFSIQAISAKESISPFRIRKLYNQADEEINQSLQAYGYYSPEIHSQLRQLLPGQWLAEFTLSPGLQTHIRQRTISVIGPGRNTIDLAQVLKTSKVKPGAALSHKEYGALKKQLSETLYRAGYLDQHFTQAQLNIYPDQAAADIELELDTGQPYYFGHVTIEQKILAPEFIERFVPFQSGDRLDTEKLLKLQFNLNDSRFFKQVNITTHREAVENFHIPIEVSTIPNKPQKYEMGFGYETDNGPHIKLGAAFPRVNRIGHQIESSATLSPTANDVTINYRIPFNKVTQDYWNFSVQGANEKTPQADHSSNSLLVGASRNESIGGGLRRIYLNYEKTHFTIDNSDQSEFLIPGIEWTKIKTNHDIYPRQGYKISADIHGAHKNAIASTSFVNTHIQLGKIIPLVAHSRLLLNGQWGTVRAQDFDQLPFSQRFRSGGDRSVRGYPYLSLGPRREDGEIKGGTFLTTASAEMDALLYKNFGAALFYDAGSVTEHQGLDVRTSAGIGFRWRSPVGMLRIDFAHPFKDSTTAYRLHFSIGPDL